MADKRFFRRMVVAASILLIILTVFWTLWVQVKGEIPMSPLRFPRGEKPLEISQAWNIILIPCLVIALGVTVGWAGELNSAKEVLGVIYSGNIMVSLFLAFLGEMASAIVLFAGYTVISTLLVGTIVATIWAIRLIGRFCKFCRMFVFAA